MLSGPTAPTWFVTWTDVGAWGPGSAMTSRLVARDYHPVARLLGRTVYLRDGVVRATPSLPGADPPASTDKVLAP